ncbi:MAG: IS1 family transposase [Acidobacteria bacterium]|nr:IS1 family transposase [Acidobacteriota bacterium]
MCYETITCPDCSSLNIIENGKTAQRKQRYLCKHCRREFASVGSVLKKTICCESRQRVAKPRLIHARLIRQRLPILTARSVK